MDTAEAARLEELEADISSVASALETVDRIVAETPDGESAATEIAAVVSPQRFPLESDAAASESSEVAVNDTRPSDTGPSDTQPTGTEPGDTEPGDTEPGDTEPGDTKPGQTVTGTARVEQGWSS
ncbi:MAG: hypothetical protein ACR2OH_13275 [Microthrixaceae bacterium]